jgi:hypothetical protein
MVISRIGVANFEESELLGGSGISARLDVGVNCFTQTFQASSTSRRLGHITKSPFDSIVRAAFQCFLELDDGVSVTESSTTKLDV